MTIKELLSTNTNLYVSSNVAIYDDFMNYALERHPLFHDTAMFLPESYYDEDVIHYAPIVERDGNITYLIHIKGGSDK